jgi:pSer/pThr/pTyr-binding forkhead associated (FHA) protein
MKQIFRQAEETVRTGVVKLRTWFDPPLDATARPLEVREAIIDHVERQVEPAGQGRRVLAHNHVTVTVLAVEKDDRAKLQAALAGLQDSVVTRLREIRCQVPQGFEVVLHFAKKPQQTWAPNQRFEVTYDTRRVAVEEPEVVPTGQPTLTITVLRGQATEASYSLVEPSVRIGRTPTPVDNHGRPRRNHVVFLEDGDEHGRTVGRAHASITYDKDRREYRLFDDGSHNGTRLVRGGVTVEVRPRDPVGVLLTSGDEIELGTATVKVEIH